MKKNELERQLLDKGFLISFNPSRKIYGHQAQILKSDNNDVVYNVCSGKETDNKVSVFLFDLDRNQISKYTYFRNGKPATNIAISKLFLN
ncbi:MAG: hypothetical protein Q4P17_07665 [Methanobacterium sp.]|nr:hypothetical protein [Methanobacterium sp.]